jgi:hypothetical protein
MPQFEELGIQQVRSNAEGALTVTPNDSTDLSKGYTKGIYIGTSGDLSVILRDGSTAIFKSISAGVIHPISATRINATGTTASNIVAVY